VQYHAVPHCNVIANGEWPPRFTELASMSDMQNRVVLNIGSIPNTNAVHVGTDCTLRPYAHIVAHDQITQHDSTRIYHHPLAKRWGYAIV
jgi:hypothetical protein